MAPIPADELVTLTRRIAQRIDPRLEVPGLLSTDHDASRAELMITIAGCHKDPCTLVLNIDRSDPGVAERELDLKLTDAIAEHRAAEVPNG